MKILFFLLPALGAAQQIAVNETNLREAVAGSVTDNFEPIADWDVSAVEDFSGLFEGLTTFNADISMWDTSSATTMKSMFRGATAFNGDLSGWDVSKVESMESMFELASSFEGSGDLSSWETGNVRATNYMFRFARVFSSDLSGWDTSKARSMSGMFEGANSFQSDLSMWSVGQVFEFADMFNGASLFASDLSGWTINESLLIVMDGMFASAKSFNSDLSSWRTGRVLSFNRMFQGADVFTGRLCWDLTSIWNQKFVTNMFSTDGACFDPDCVSERVLAISGSTPECSGLYPATDAPSGVPSDSPSSRPTIVASALPSSFPSIAPSPVPSIAPSPVPTTGAPSFAPVPNTTSTPSATTSSPTASPSEAPSTSMPTFQPSVAPSTSMPTFLPSVAPSVVPPPTLPGVDATNIRDALADWPLQESLFAPISTWDVSGVTDMSNLFSRLPFFNEDISMWDVSSVTDMSLMFFGSLDFNQNLGGWDVSNVKNMESMFEFAMSFEGDGIEAWNVEKVTRMRNMFKNANAFDGDLSSWSVGAVTEMSGMFSQAVKFNSDLSGWDTSDAVAMSEMFAGATVFESDLSLWNTRNVFVMNRMFNGADAFEGKLCWDLSFIPEPLFASDVFSTTGACFNPMCTASIILASTGSSPICTMVETSAPSMLIETSAPSVSRAPSVSPTSQPSVSPTSKPITSTPTFSPSLSPTPEPSPLPTLEPVTTTPSLRPTLSPTSSPSLSPSEAPSFNMTCQENLFFNETREACQCNPGLISLGDGVCICFSSENSVDVLNRGLVPMKHLEIGDMVKTDNGDYSRVYSFGHRDDKTKAAYLQIHVKSLEQPLEISGDHMVFTSENHATPASNLKTGDKLLLENGSLAEIHNILVVERQGAYAPFTMSGKIAVSNVVSSSYVALEENADMFTVGGVGLVSNQWLAHRFQAIHRLVCTLSSCEAETYNDEGISNWVAGPLSASRWWLNQNDIVKAAVFLPTVIALLFVGAVEWLLTSASSIPLCLFIVTVFVYRRSIIAKHS